jgi:Zn-dependent membrane protease YugP
MIWILAILAGVALFLGPSLWVQWVMRRHDTPRADFPGTGAELARHLLDEAGLEAVPIEESTSDHYDPEAKAVRLSKGNYHGRSLTAVTVAAHEVGHALQDRDGYAPLKARGGVVRAAIYADRAVSIGMVGLSVAGGIAVHPRLMLLGAVAIMLSGLLRVGANLVTLPVETDASFNRAMPLLGRYLPPEDEPAVRRILRAAAFTYVAAALISVLNLFRFFRFFR